MSEASPAVGSRTAQRAIGGLHHVEVWVPDLDVALVGWGWLFGELGWDLYQEFPGGRSFRLGETYIVLEQSPALTAADHDRCRPGLNHLAFHAGSRSAVDRLVSEGAAHGWTLMFADRHPFAGGPDHYAAFLEDPQGYEIELIAA